MKLHENVNSSAGETPGIGKAAVISSSLLLSSPHWPSSPTPCSQQATTLYQPGRGAGKGSQGREKGIGEGGEHRIERLEHIPGLWSPEKDWVSDSVFLQAVAEKGYETGEHAPGLKLGGCGAYKAAHHIIKVKSLLELGLKLCVN